MPGAPQFAGQPASLEPGLHDDMTLTGLNSVVLIEQIDGKALAMALNLTECEGVEGPSARPWPRDVIVIFILGLVVMWRLGRVIQPLAALARQVEALKPAQPNQQVGLDANASAELVVIADAFNDYLRRNQSFVEREQAFIASSSHELRTPIAVIAGASELVLEQADMSAAARNQVARIHRTARNVEQLISLLLTLAKDPARLADSSDRVALDQLLPGIVEDHRHLTRDKDLSLFLEPLPSCEIVAPEAIVQAAIGNLLRNAIENSDRGEIRIAASRCHRGDRRSRATACRRKKSAHCMRRSRAAAAMGRHRPGPDLAPVRTLGWRLAFPPCPDAAPAPRCTCARVPRAMCGCGSGVAASSCSNPEGESSRLTPAPTPLPHPHFNRRALLPPALRFLFLRRARGAIVLAHFVPHAVGIASRRQADAEYQEKYHMVFLVGMVVLFDASALTCRAARGTPTGVQDDQGRNRQVTSSMTNKVRGWKSNPTRQAGNRMGGRRQQERKHGTPW